MLAFLILLLAGPLGANEALCAQCHQGRVVIDLSYFSPGDGGRTGMPIIKLHAYYYSEEVVSSERKGGSGDASSASRFRLELKDAPNAVLRVRFDGLQLVDAGGQPACEELVTVSAPAIQSGILLSPGEALCVAGRVKKENGDVALISEWPRAGQMTAELLHSNADPKIKPGIGVAYFVPANPQSLSLYHVFESVINNPAQYAICLPLFIVLGLLVAAMGYQGKSPFSLFDITVPRLPQMKKVRMKSPTIPFQLAYKGRMSDRILNRAKKAMVAQMLKLYEGADAATKARIRKDLPGLMEKPTSAEMFQANKDRLERMIGESRAHAGRQERTRRTAMRLMEIAAALELDKDTTARARGGGGTTWESNLSGKVNRVLNEWGPRVAKPWLLIPAVNRFAKRHESMDRLPGLPFVERVGMVAANWWTSRAGNVTLRRDIYKSLAANALHSMGVKVVDGEGGSWMTRKKGWLDRNLFDGKKVGELPAVPERERELMYLMGHAVLDLHIQKLMEAIYLERTEDAKGKVRYTIHGARMRLVLQAIAEARQAANAGLGPNGEAGAGVHPELVLRRELTRALSVRIEGMLRNNEIAMSDLSGRRLGPQEIWRFLQQARGQADDVAGLLNADGRWLRIKERDAQGQERWVYRLQADQKAPLGQGALDLNSIHDRFLRMVGIYDTYFRQWQNADRVPLVFLGIDLADAAGRAVLLRNRSRAGQGLAENLGAEETEERGVRDIRRVMEEELMKKRLFASIMNGKIEAKMLDDRNRMRSWIREKLSVDKLRKELDYNLRGEWSARNFLTGFVPGGDYVGLAERNKIDVLRNFYSYEFGEGLKGKGYENLFRNFRREVDRTVMLYESLKALAPFYMNGQKWNADTYLAWQKNGVTYGDISKGVWLIGPDRTITPLPSGFMRDANGRVVGALKEVSDANPDRLTYIRDPRELRDANQQLTGYRSTVFNMLISDYGERPINAALLYQTSSGKWKPGAPTDLQTMRISGTLPGIWSDLVMPKIGEGRDITDERRTVRNTFRLEQQLAEKVRLVPHSALVSKNEEGSGISAWTRNWYRATKFAENVIRGGAHRTDERLHEWYSTQAMVRVVLNTFSRNFEETDEKKSMLSDETRESMEAKGRMEKLQIKRNDLMKKMAEKLGEWNEQHLVSESGKISHRKERQYGMMQNRLELLRADIARQEGIVRDSEKKAFRLNRPLGLQPDRTLFDVAQMATPFYSVAELTVMRDPRVVFGGGYGLGPAIMGGYQTGQFVSERPMMWAGYHLAPGDRLLNFLARPSYYAAMAYGMATRSFFTKLTGYTTIYHLDPDRGGKSYHEPGPMEGFQSLFRPSQGFDWLTRFMNPMRRRKWTDEMGWHLSEEGGGQGTRSVGLFTMKYAGTEDAYRIDKNAAKLEGRDIRKDLLHHKPGRDFRELNEQWEKGLDAEAVQHTQNTIRHLRKMRTETNDATERRNLNYMIKELEDTARVEGAVSKLPVIGKWMAQGYYSVENRSGYDINAIGGGHRPLEMWWAPYKNVGKGTSSAGMLYTDLQTGSWEPFSRVGRTLAMARPEIDGASTRLMGTLFASEDEGGLGRDLRRDMLRDTFRRETPLISKFMELENERLSFSLLNSPYILPLAPLYVGAFNFGYRKIKNARRQAWNSEMPKEEHKPARAALERAEQAISLQAPHAAAMGNWFRCPTHGLEMRAGSPCPLCKSIEEHRIEEEGRGHRLRRYWEHTKNLAQSLSLGQSSERYYFKYSQAHCPTHGIDYDRGTLCPMCLDRQVNEGNIERGEARTLRRELAKIQKEMAGVYKGRWTDDAGDTVRVKSDAEGDIRKGVRMAELFRRREQLLEGLHMQKERDTRMGYRPSQVYLRHKMREGAQEDKRFDVEFDVS